MKEFKKTCILAIELTFALFMLWFCFNIFAFLIHLFFGITFIAFKIAILALIVILGFYVVKSVLKALKYIVNNKK